MNWNIEKDFQDFQICINVPLIFFLKVTYIVLTARNQEFILNQVIPTIDLRYFQLTEAVLRRCSVKKVFLNISQSPDACNFIKKETLTQVFSCEFCEIFRNTFFYRTPLVAASDLSHILWWLSWYYNFCFSLFRSTMSGNALIRK